MDGFDDYRLHDFSNWEGPGWDRIQQKGSENVSETKTIDWKQLMQVAPVVDIVITKPKPETKAMEGNGDIAGAFKTFVDSLANCKTPGELEANAKLLGVNAGLAEKSAPPEKPMPVVGLNIETGPTNAEITEVMKAGATIKW